MQLVIHGQKKKPYVNNLKVRPEGAIKKFLGFEATFFMHRVEEIYNQINFPKSICLYIFLALLFQNE